MEQFLSTVNSRVVNRKAMESLIKSGAFDAFGERATLLGNLDIMMAYAARLQKQVASGQADLFGELIEDVKPKLTLTAATAPADPREQLLWERELLGLYLSRHPLELFETYLAEQTVPLNSIKPEHDGRAVVIGGSVLDVREITTKNGQKMAFVRVEDRFGEIEAVLFPSSYQQTLGTWERDKVVLVRGKVSSRGRDGQAGDEAKIMVDDAREITVEQAQQYQATGKKRKAPKPSAKAATVPMASAQISDIKPPKVYVRLDSGANKEALLSLKAAMDEHHGSTDVVLVLGSADSRQAIKLPGGIDTEGQGVNRLSELVGAENVKLQ
jgi:DNA polymerase-3 subunit alpha